MPQYQKGVLMVLLSTTLAQQKAFLFLGKEKVTRDQIPQLILGKMSTFAVEKINELDVTSREATGF